MLDQPLTHSFTPGKSEGTTILKLEGPLTLSSIFGFQNEFRTHTPQVMIVDLSESPYMDSAGLGLLMNYYVSAESHGRKLLLAGTNERIDSLRRAVLALPPAYREVVVLCDLHELDYAEAATALDCAIGTVRSRLHRARALLTEKMRAEERCAV